MARGLTAGSLATLWSSLRSGISPRRPCAARRSDRAVRAGGSSAAASSILVSTLGTPWAESARRDPVLGATHEWPYRIDRLLCSPAIGTPDGSPGVVVGTLCPVPDVEWDLAARRRARGVRRRAVSGRVRLPSGHRAGGDSDVENLTLPLGTMVELDVVADALVALEPAVVQGEWRRGLRARGTGDRAGVGMAARSGRGAARSARGDDDAFHEAFGTPEPRAVAHADDARHGVRSVLADEGARHDDGDDAARARRQGAARGPRHALHPELRRADGQTARLRSGTCSPTARASPGVAAALQGGREGREVSGTTRFSGSAASAPMVFEAIHRERPEYVARLRARSTATSASSCWASSWSLVTHQPLDRFCQSASFGRSALRATAFIDLDRCAAQKLTPVVDLIAPTERCPWRGKILCGEVHDDNAYAIGGVAGHAGAFANRDRRPHASRRRCSGVCGRPGRFPAAGRVGARVLAPRSATVADSTWTLGWDTPVGAGVDGRHACVGVDDRTPRLHRNLDLDRSTSAAPT